MFKIAFLISILSIIVGCSTSSVKPDFLFDQNSPDGLLVTSLEYKGLLSGYNIYFRGIDNEESGRFEVGAGATLIPIHPKSDIPGVHAKLYVTALKPGKYEVYRWYVSSGMAYIEPIKEFSIPFEITPGKATYIGSYVFKVQKALGLTVTDVGVTHEDHFERDAEILKRKHPNIDTQHLESIFNNLTSSNGVLGAGG